MNCSSCKSEIEADSFHCDQCGHEIFICETCLIPRQGQWCPEDGGMIVRAKEFRTNSKTQDKVEHANKVPLKTERLEVSSATLQLVNAPLGITLLIQHDTVLGRASGPYSGQLANHARISGQHLSFNYDAIEGWSCKDLGSTNGTKYGPVNTNWGTMAKLTPGNSIKLKNNHFILIANVEFLVTIKSY